MSRLDEHVGLVRMKLTFAAFVRVLPWAITALAGAALLVVLVEKYTKLQLYRPGVGHGWTGHDVADANLPDVTFSKQIFPWIWLWVGLGISFVASLVYAFLHRPTARQAAVAIDERLGLKEKFSTAL